MKWNRIGFLSFVKFSAYWGIAVGITAAVFGLVCSFFGIDTKADLIFIHAEGVAAGFLGLIVWPLLFCFVCIAAGILSFLPFRLILSLDKGNEIDIS